MTAEFEPARAACTVTDPRGDGKLLARQAFRLGRRLARLGGVPSLPLLLDFVALVQKPACLSSRTPPDHRTYLAELTTAVEAVRVALALDADEKNSRPDEGDDLERDLLPFVAAGIDRDPAGAAPSPDFVNAACAYVSLESRLVETAGAWKGGARSRGDGVLARDVAWLQRLNRALAPDGAGAAAQVLAVRSRFSAGAQASFAATAAERLDPRAVRLFVTAGPRRGLNPVDGRMVRRHDIAVRASNPVWDATQEQDPHFGAIALSTLLLDEEGDRRIVEGGGPKIGNPWSVAGLQAAELTLAWRALADGGSESRSGLQAFMALLLDDLRFVLWNLPITFSLQRLDRHGLVSAHAGRRHHGFQSLDKGTGRHLPTPAATQLLFSRPTALPLLDWGPAPGHDLRDNSELPRRWRAVLLRNQRKRPARVPQLRLAVAAELLAGDGEPSSGQVPFPAEARVRLGFRPGTKGGLGLELVTSDLIVTPAAAAATPGAADDVWLAELRSRIVGHVLSHFGVPRELTHAVA